MTNDTDVPLRKHIIMYYTRLCINLLHHRTQRHMVFQHTSSTVTSEYSLAKVQWAIITKNLSKISTQNMENLACVCCAKKCLVSIVIH